MKTALVLGAGGFIGSHMVKRLKAEGYWVRGVDLKEPEFATSEADEFHLYDLRIPANVDAVMMLGKLLKFSYLPVPFGDQTPFDEVYQFAADMGGAGYIFSGEHDADVMHNSVSINTNVAYYAHHRKAKKVFFSSSACMYPEDLQSEHGRDTDDEHDSDKIGNYGRIGLRESDAYPASPDSEYGWEKLFSERLYLAYARNYGLDVRIARFHNIYGPEGTYKGGKEKAPAAMCRKASSTFMHRGDIVIWGDGQQTRSFLYIDDCIDAVRLLMASDFKQPINIGSEEMVTIDRLADLAIEFSGKHDITKHYDTTQPQGVRGRNSDNTLIRSVLNWSPKVSLREGMEKTYRWVEDQLIQELKRRHPEINYPKQ